MPRLEFTRKTRRQAFERAAGNCEAVGARYGLPDDGGYRGCINKPCEVDHDKTAEEGGTNELSNAVALCRKCHAWKTANDLRRIRKADRMRDKHTHAMKPSRNPMPGSRNSRFRKRMDGTTERRW